MPGNKRLIAAFAVVVGLTVAAIAFNSSAEAKPYCPPGHGHGHGHAHGHCPTLFVSASAVVPGQTITDSGTGYQPNETVTITLHSDPVVLGTATGDSSGAWSTQVMIPSDTSLGTHTITAIGTAGNFASVTITVVAPPSTAG